MAMQAFGHGCGMRGFGKLAGLVSAFALAHVAGGAYAASREAAPRPAKVEQAGSTKSLNPALFELTNGKGSIYLLGSIHLLPVGFSWHTPALDQVINTADVFVFEADLDNSTAEFHYFIDNYGYLPRGQTLHKMLSTPALMKYVSLIQGNHIDSAKLDYLRPGVAAVMLEPALMRTHIPVPLGPGVDATLVNYAKLHGKQLAYLESLQTQFEVLTALGGGSDPAVLEKELMSQSKQSDGFKTMLDAWIKGDLPKLTSLDNADADPKERALVLDNRNKAWLPTIEAMLRDSKTYLITVGALHLTGPNGVIGLLCARHWKVQRVQTGPTPPPAACPA
jgi:uncharacterized protein